MKKNLCLLALLLQTSITYATDFTLEAGVMDWSDKAEEAFGDQRSTNPFLKLHGYNATEFGDIYGNVQLEDIDKSAELGVEVVLIGQANLGETGFNLYSQVYVKNEPDWSETLILPGISWDKVLNNGLYVQAAVAANFVVADYRGLGVTNWENGYNGGYLTLTASKGFTLWEQNFNLMWNQEHYFGRDDLYLNITGEDEAFGYNGWLVLDWQIIPSAAMSLSYRYSQNNMGLKGYSDGVFYSLKYNF
ncbi:hypothetical protein L2737_14595 [Shewanella electrodiphila]|uniref:Ion channel protein Tsx n=1 Tax=Shewanella electrodiphila TaxID=934143 RepID=A0ABT0KRQ5_9GAMM|nr:outer membrane protein OmpK [Shewanella electrodiphila]MCL1046540.1 hypothetical protein [Shewanella electrodiphila]